MTDNGYEPLGPPGKAAAGSDAAPDTETIGTSNTMPSLMSGIMSEKAPSAGAAPKKAKAAPTPKAASTPKATATPETKPISKVQTVKSASSEMEHLEDEPKSRPSNADMISIALIGLITLIVIVISIPIILTGFGAIDVFADALRDYDGFLLFYFKEPVLQIPITIAPE